MSTTLKITYLSKSGTSALAVVNKRFGFATTMVASGWIKVDKGTKVGDTVELPDSTIVNVVTQQSEPDGDGVVTDFNWLVLS